MSASLKNKQGKKIRGAGYSRGDVIFYSLLLALPLLQICIFYFAVNFQSILMAFQRYETTTNKFVFDWDASWDKFKLEINEDYFWPMIGNSVSVWLITSLVGTSLAVFFAYYIYRKYTMSGFFRFVLFLPSIMPSILLVVLFKNFAGRGLPHLLNEAFNKPWDPTGNTVFSIYNDSRFWIITLFSVWIGFGPQVLVYTGAMDQIPTEQLEAAKIDGATPLREFVSIIVPSIIATIGTFLTTGVASLFTNNNNLFSFLGGMAQNNITTERTMGYHLYCLVYEDNTMANYCYAAFLGILCTIIIVPLALGVRKAVERVQE